MLYELIIFLLTGVIYVNLSGYIEKTGLLNQTIFQNKLVRVVLFLILFSLTVMFKLRRDDAIKHSPEFIINEVIYLNLFITQIRWIGSSIFNRSKKGQEDQCSTRV